MLKRTLTTAAIAVFALQALAGSAHAGTYHVYTCRTPAGEPAPTDGWVGSKVGTFIELNNTCEQPGGFLLAALGDQPLREANTSRATWTFTAPGGAKVLSATLWRAGDSDGGAGINAWYQFALSGPSEGGVFDRCAYIASCTSGLGDVSVPSAGANIVVLPATNAGGSLFVSASCSGLDEYECPAGKGDPNGYAAAVYLFAADITLEQAAAPSVSAVQGELAETASVSGTSPLLFSAADPGSGVYAAVFSIDGTVVQRTLIDDNGGRCKDVGQSGDGLPAFLYLQPCKASVSADVGFDTAAIANGTHHLVVSVTDAAGNAAPVLDRTITVANSSQPGAQGAQGAQGAGAVAALPGSALPGAPNGANASVGARLAVSWKGSKGARLTSSYGRALTIEGRLTDKAGAAIAGALLEVSATPSYTGAATLAMAPVRTNGDGRFTVRLPRGVSSRAIRFAYRAHLDDVSAAASAALTLAVHAGLSLSIRPRVASVGRSISFHGRLLGAPLPRGGKQLVLEARAPRGRWIVFNVIRTRAHGQFRAKYRFRFPGPATYQFRVHCEAEAAYPYAAGNSNAVSVRER